MGAYGSPELGQYRETLARKNSYKPFIIAIVVMVVLFMTNPTKEDFSNWALKQMNSKTTTTEYQSDLERAGAVLGNALAKTLINNLVTRHNYYLFSTYTIDGTNFGTTGKVTIIGVGTLFIKLPPTEN